MVDILNIPSSIVGLCTFDIIQDDYFQLAQFFYRYVFDSLTETQAETLLENHGSLGSYLLSQYDDCNNYRLSFIAV